MSSALARGQAAAGLTVAAIGYDVALLAVTVGQGEPPVLGPFGPPLLVSLLMWVLLRARCQGGSPWLSEAARPLAFVYMTYGLMGALSIAPWAFPPAFLLFLAALLTPDGEREDGAPGCLEPR